MMSGSQEEPPQPSSFLTSASPHNAPVAVHISFPTGTSFTISLMDKATSRLHVGKYSLDNDPTMAHDKFESIKLCVASAAADFRAEQVQTQLEQTTAPDPPSSQSQSQPPLLTQQPLLSLTQSTPAPPDTAQTFSLFTVSSQNITFIVKQQQKTFTKTLLTLPLYACGADKVGLFVENIILNWSSENERNRALTLSNASLVTAAQDWQDATTKLSTQLQLRENELVTNFVVVLNEKKAETDKLRAQLEAEKKKKGTGGGEGEGEDIGGSTDVADVPEKKKKHDKTTDRNDNDVRAFEQAQNAVKRKAGGFVEVKQEGQSKKAKTAELHGSKLMFSLDDNVALERMVNKGEASAVAVAQAAKKKETGLDLGGFSDSSEEELC